MPECKASEILRSETYVNCTSQQRRMRERRSWAFFNSLSEGIDLILNEVDPVLPENIPRIV